MWKNFYLVENEINQYIARFEVCPFVAAVAFVWRKLQKVSKSPEELKDLVSCLMEWYKAWVSPEEWVGPYCFNDHFWPAFPRLRATVFSSYTLNFHTRLFSTLPPSFTIAFKDLCACLLAPPETNPDEEEQEQVRPKWDPNMDSIVWKNYEIFGAYRSLRKHHRDHWTRVHRRTCVEDAYGWVGEAYVRGSAGVDVGEGCTVDVACVCERGFQLYVLFTIFLMSCNVSNDNV